MQASLKVKYYAEIQTQLTVIAIPVDITGAQPKPGFCRVAYI
jgi:hypothetical protein